MWSKESIRSLLDKNPLAVDRALVRLYEAQLPAERGGSAVVHNDKGFCSWSAPMGCSLAKQILKGYPLSEKQRYHALRIARHHAVQLADLANRALRAKKEVEKRSVPELMPKEEMVKEIGELIERL